MENEENITGPSTVPTEKGLGRAGKGRIVGEFSSALINPAGRGIAVNQTINTLQSYQMRDKQRHRLHNKKNNGEPNGGVFGIKARA